MTGKEQMLYDNKNNTKNEAHKLNDYEQQHSQNTID